MALLVKLSDATLADLPDGVKRPNYDRSKLSAGIVHIGVGNFHRAHQAWYLHRLMQKGLAHDWAIVGAGVRPFDEGQRLKFEAQDYLTTLIELDPAGRGAEVIGSMIDYVPVSNGHADLIERMAQPDIRIVSLTVTEGGYFVDSAKGGFDKSHPDILHDAANPEHPRTAFGAIVAALSRRRAAGLAPFTGQSCDNLQHNGKVLREAVVSLARLSDPELADWIDLNCAFPDAMVDCIVPATGPGEIGAVQDFGIDDAVPVTHESFRQWVIEDAFCLGRPPWEQAGATIAENVGDFERMKLRMLNGGHQILANLGELLSVKTIAGTMEHPLIRGVFEKVERDEVIPHIDAVPGFSPSQYLAILQRRFANPLIVDSTRRVAFDGSSRHPGFLFGSIRDCLAGELPITGLALVEAAWARMCYGTRDDGTAIEPNDPQWDVLNAAARRAKHDPAQWLAMHQIYGDLGSVPAFSEAFAKWLSMMWADGVEQTLRVYLSA